ncbi:MAG: hypothetical protein WC718_12280, partial [Phycisphaerales bacterium]
GAVLGYVPIAPQADPIAKPVCVDVTPAVRDALARFIADTPEGLELARRAAAAGATTADITAHLAGEATPQHLVLRLGKNAERALLQEALRDLALHTPALCVTLRAPRGMALDPLLVAGVGETAAMAQAYGAFVHLRTALPANAPDHAAALAHADVVSIDIPGDTQDVFARLGGAGLLDDLRSRVAALIRRGFGEGSISPLPLPRPWIVPRLERRDETYGDIENFYHRWLLACGACVIDPPHHEYPGQRIERLPLPASVAAFERRATLDIDSDGTIYDGAGTRLGTLLEHSILDFAGVATETMA